MKRPAYVSLIAVVIVVLDQVTKALIEAYVLPYEPIPVISGFFNIVNVRNPGAAFGLFADSGSMRLVILIGFTVVAFGAIIYLLRDAQTRAMVTALSLVTGGAVGNLVDRIRYGEVVDFLDVYVGTYHWPAFNVADSCITVGISVAIFMYLFGYENPGETSGEEESGDTDQNP